jgi:hypothetical protein
MVNRSDCSGGYYRRDGKVEQYTRKHDSLPVDLVRRHFQATRTGHVIGLHATRYCPDGVCRSQWGATDIDRHKPTDDARANGRAALTWHRRFISLGFYPLLIDSNGSGGFRNIVIFKAPVVTRDVYCLFRWLTQDWAELGLPRRPEIFPSKPEINPPGSKSRSFGPWLRIPGRHHKRPHHWTRVWDDNHKRWLAGNAAIDAILATTGDDPGLIPAEALTVDPPAHSVGTPRRTITLRATPQPQQEHPADQHSDSADGSTDERHVVSSSEPDNSPPAGLVRRAERALRYLGRGARDESGHEYASDYDLWLKVGMALHELGDAGLPLWIAWSRKCPAKFDEEACRSKWSTFTRAGGVTIGWLYAQAKRRGWK